ncbi:MAG: hypothetical protein BMS9Abin26_0002 [Gammaproteobacteria bacterium]|nr:MAG: hypothetical protein BMS9Abin26_0002 [Gammaproteobacteria bacterium]
MREFRRSPSGEIVDLDDSETYSHLPGNRKDCVDLLFQKIGFTHLYMNYIYPESFTDGKGLEQKNRVHEFISKYVDTDKSGIDDVLWYQEQVFLFQDEIENMC